MTTSLHARVGEVTERIVKRSRDRRRPYLDRIDHTIGKGPTRKKLGCANFAHGFAACGPEDKHALRDGDAPIWRSSRPTTTCFRRISRSSAFPN